MGYLTATLLCDFYKISHKDQYPENTQEVYSTWTPRSNKHLPQAPYAVCFGVQGFIQEFLVDFFNENFFNRPKQDVVDEYNRFIKNTLMVEPDASHIEKLHDLGYLPLEIKSLAEGTKVPFRVPMLTIRNTNTEFAWLTNYIETMASANLWKPSTTATIASLYRGILDKYALETTGSVEGVEFQGHDFSMRGLSGVEDAARSGAGHLLSFAGTDTIPAIQYLEKFYNANIEEELVGTSVPATEHSVACSYGKDNEFEYYRKLIKDVYPSGIVSLVSDTWDLWNVVTNYLPKLKEDIMARSGGFIDKVVIRPDCYDEDTLIKTDNGWEYFKNINENTKVAQVLDDGTYEYVKPLKIVNQPYKGKMFKFSDHHGKIDMLVTPNHRMVYERNGQFKVKTAEDITLTDYRNKFIRSAEKRTGTINNLTDDERLQIAFQADGSYQTGYNNRIRFAFSKERKINRIKDILDRLNYKYKVYNLKDDRVEISVKEELDYVKDFSWVNLKDSTGNFCKQFIEELSHWDATIRDEGRIKFDTTNSNVISVVEEIAFNAGYGCFVSTKVDNRDEKFSDVFTAHILKNNAITLQSLNKEEVEYDGNVYCVQVPTGRLLVKRNKSTLVCGNSGDPTRILCGDPEADPSSPAFKGVVELLWDIFGGTTTEQGFKVLDSHIGAIYGDAITLERCEEICKRLMEKGFASTNVVYGIGSYTYQYLTRDSLGFAMKATNVTINGKSTPIFKDPITDDGTKKSARGKVAVYRDPITKEINYMDSDSPSRAINDLLTTVFENGQMKVNTSLAQVKSKLNER